MSVSLTEERVVEVIARHVSRINARVIAERGRRVLREPPNVALDERARFLAAIRSSAMLFVKSAGALDQLLRDLDQLQPADVPPEAPIEIEVANEGDLRTARLTARDLCNRLGASSYVMQSVATAVSELARNIVSYTPGGRITLTTLAGIPLRLRLVAEDRGAGIPNLDDILSGRYRSKTGLGRGLIGIKQLMEHAEIETGPTGTRVTAEMTLR